MSDFQEQLAHLRRRIAKIDKKYASPKRTPPPASSGQPLAAPEEWLNGEEVSTAHGRHYEFEKLYERHRRHGSIGIVDLEDLPGDLLEPISNGEIRGVPPSKWCFLDTETTGLAGGSGTYAFLVGVGRITPQGFRVRQFFMRDFGEEASQLSALTEHLKQFEVLITYNGRTYDQPLLETRFRMTRQRPPFSSLAHLDLLFGARRLWNLRFDSCRLVDLENQILGVERQGDLPGELIPYVYFEYIRTREIFSLLPVFHHNAIDILTLACLTAIVPRAFHAPGDSVNGPEFAHGAEMVGLARWWRQAEQHENSLALFRQALNRNLSDDLLFRTMWDIAALEKKLGREHAALPLLTDLAASKNPLQASAFVELAKYYEHRERNYSMALEMTRNALAIEDSEALRRRAARLEKRVPAGKAIRLL
ncbi:MAG TPA: ribonuclease H-like domain-containing protein [Bryobacteraceae bacterium]|nr:ribonuclease H-like domain-containing protein [Bryobacteraceae bacterium]